ncbi:MAG: Lrp/AsnC family transcriptional regulator [Caulobacterales bacterium]
MTGTSSRSTRPQRQAALFAPNGAELDLIDLAVLRLLAEDATHTVQDIARLIDLSHSAASQRLRRLEACGAIVGRIAVIDEQVFAPWVTMSVDVVLTARGRRSRSALYAAFTAAPEVLEAQEIVGDCDVHLRVGLPSAAHWPALEDQLDPTGRLIALTRVSLAGRTVKRMSLHPRLKVRQP